jgi:hypothetical protein
MPKTLKAEKLDGRRMRSKARSAVREPVADTEPVTAEDLRAIEEGRDAFRRGDYMTVDEAKQHVARLRSKKGRSKPRAATKK